MDENIRRRLSWIRSPFGPCSMQYDLIKCFLSHSDSEMIRMSQRLWHITEDNRLVITGDGANIGSSVDNWEGLTSYSTQLDENDEITYDIERERWVLSRAGIGKDGCG